MGEAVDFQVMVRYRDVHFLKENVGHIVIEMLAGMDYDFPYPFGFADDPANSCRFDKLWPGANNSNDLFQDLSIFNSSLSWRVRFFRENLSISLLSTVR